MNKRYLWIGIIVLALVVLRIPSLIHPVLDVDESIYGLFARIWFDGGIPYTDCVETKPLGIYFLFGTVFSIFGKWNMIAVHAVTILIVGATSYVLYKISELLYSKEAGLWAALLYAVFTTTYFPKIIATTIEPVMLLPVALQFFYWLKYEREEKSYYAILSGFFFGLSCCFKYQAGMNLIVFFAYFLFILRRVPPKGVGRLFCGALIPPAIMLAYLYFYQALDGFIFWNITGNKEYIEGGSTSISLLKQLRGRFLPYFASTFLLWITAIIGSRSAIKNRSKHELLIVIWFVLSIIPVSAGFRFYGHYFLLLLPPMSVLASPVLEKLWKDTSKKALKAVVIVLIILPAIGFTVARFYITEIHVAVGEDNLEDYKPLGAYVKERTSNNERIIAWGFAPMIYWNAERLPGTRFFWSDLLTGRTPGRRSDQPQDILDSKLDQRYWDMFFSDLENHKPVYIIDTAPAGLHDYKDFPVTRYPKLFKYITDNYKEETVINKVVFYRRLK